MQATTALPAGYRHQDTLDLSKSRRAVFGAVVSGIVLLIGVGWLLVQFVDLLRPGVLQGTGLRDVLTITPDGKGSIAIPFQLVADGVVAFILALLIHELVHGVFFWWFARERPTFGIKRLLVYVSAPPEVYFPRNQYLIVGIAPFVLVTLVGALLMMVVPVVVVPTLMLFIAFNAAGAAGDLQMFVRLLSYSPNTLMQDSGTSVFVYGPDKDQRVA